MSARADLGVEALAASVLSPREQYRRDIRMEVAGLYGIIDPFDPDAESVCCSPVVHQALKYAHVTGSSHGGDLSALMMMLDDRLLDLLIGEAV